jgi:hypothetical protein
MTLNERFWSKVDKTGDCWIWKGTKTRAGYGVKIINHKAYYVHRLMWGSLNGEIPNGMEICHRCDNPPCIRPEHLFLGSQADNTRDAIKKGRLDNYGEKNGMAKLTSAQVREIKRVYVHSPRGQTSHGKKNSQAYLASLYDVTRYAIRAIVNGKTWKKEINNG